MSVLKSMLSRVKTGAEPSAVPTAPAEPSSAPPATACPDCAQLRDQVAQLRTDLRETQDQLDAARAEAAVHNAAAAAQAALVAEMTEALGTAVDLEDKAEALQAETNAQRRDIAALQATNAELQAQLDAARAAAADAESAALLSEQLSAARAAVTAAETAKAKADADHAAELRRLLAEADDRRLARATDDAATIVQREGLRKALATAAQQLARTQKLIEDAKATNDHLDAQRDRHVDTPLPTFDATGEALAHSALRVVDDDDDNDDDDDDDVVVVSTDQPRPSVSPRQVQKHAPLTGDMQRTWEEPPRLFVKAAHPATLECDDNDTSTAAAVAALFAVDGASSTNQDVAAARVAMAQAMCIGTNAHKEAQFYLYARAHIDAQPFWMLLPATLDIAPGSSTFGVTLEALRRVVVLFRALVSYNTTGTRCVSKYGCLLSPHEMQLLFRAIDGASWTHKKDAVVVDAADADTAIRDFNTKRSAPAAVPMVRNKMLRLAIEHDKEDLEILHAARGITSSFDELLTKKKKKKTTTTTTTTSDKATRKRKHSNAAQEDDVTDEVPIATLLALPQKKRARRESQKLPPVVSDSDSNPPSDDDDDNNNDDDDDDDEYSDPYRNGSIPAGGDDDDDDDLLGDWHELPADDDE